MKRVQIQLPEPLFQQLKTVAGARGLSFAELVRRGMETYVQSCPEIEPGNHKWTMPVLRGSGGHLIDPATFQAEADAVEKRFTRN